MKVETFGNRVLQFNDYLSKVNIDLPDEFRIINPFNGLNKKDINEITNIFYNTFYNDNNSRRLIIGSSPARKGTAVTGVPYEDSEHLKEITGINIDNFYVNKSSSNFLYEVIDKYGGSNKFYSDFYMNFVCPLGIVRINLNGKEVNCNYYENKKVKEIMKPFILETLKMQIDLGIDTSVVFCIGSGENYKFLNELNNEYHLFEKIISLEHPRFIMQYNSKNKDKYINKYLNVLNEER